MLPYNNDMTQKILIVEDNPQIRKLLFLFLKDSYEVIAAENGVEGIEFWRKYKPDLAILDIMLPDLSGYEVCASAKADLDLRSTPTIFLSAKSSDEARLKGYKLGAVNYLVKPVKKDELIAVIDSTLRMIGSNQDYYNTLEEEDLCLNVDTLEVRVGNTPVEFTPIEFRILYAFMIKINRVLSREALINALKKEGRSISDRTIDSHISHIRKKIKISNLKISSVYGEGYKLTHRN